MESLLILCLTAYCVLSFVLVGKLAWIMILEWYRDRTVGNTVTVALLALWAILLLVMGTVAAAEQLAAHTVG